ncbi:b(0,+)-type amino acid transporter 1-like [Apostichopus japonicus]|uniref:b(0,+)-type amino acid transporter 1-like n=1 Tax=Stichopus japonicus TaxID=307972 RepID=UPI003AB3E2F7
MATDVDSEQEHTNRGSNVIGGNEGKVQLLRQITLLGGVSYVVGSMIGSGIFVSPTYVLQQTQSVGMSLIIWLICGLLSACGALCYAELGTMIPKSGGEYPYLYTTYGAPVAFLYSWIAVIIRGPSSLSIITLTFSEYAIQPFYPEEQCDPPEVLIKMVACVCIGLLTLVNCVSVKGATNIQVVFTVAKLFALVIIIVSGFVKLGQGNTQYLDPSVSFQGSATNVFAYGIAFYQGFWAYEGWNQLNFMTEELINPYRNLPLGIMIGISLVTVVYLLTNVAYFAVMSPEEMLATSAVAITFANRTLGPMAWIMPFLVCCSTFGAANGSLFASGRIVYAVGREGHTAQILSMVHTSYITPQPAILFTALLAIAMLIPNDFGTLVNYFSFTAWIFYGLTTTAVVILRIRHPEWKRPVKVPLVLPIIVTVLAIYLLIAPIVDAPTFGYLYAGIIFLAGLLIYYPMIYRGYSPKFMDYVTIFFQQLLQVAPSYYSAPEEDDGNTAVKEEDLKITD